MLKRTKRVSLVEQVVEQIEGLIESKHWVVGEKIPPEMELMEKFDVSRNTLREAIRALVHAGLLETRQGSGTIVRSSSALEVVLHRHIEKTSVIETLEVRSALEQEAAELAAQRRSEEQLRAMKKSIKACKEAADNGDMEQFVIADMTFHKLVVKSANNQLLLDLYEHMTDALSSSIRDVTGSSTFFDYDKEIHSNLLAAIEKQDVSKARKYVSEYINAFKERLYEGK